MPEILSVLTTTVEAMKKLKEVSDKIKNAEISNMIADLSMALADLKMEIVDLKDENTSLQAELASMRESENVRDLLELRDGLYYLKEEYQGRPEGPYCTRCFDADQQLVLVTSLPRGFHDVAKYRCPGCQATFV